LTLPQQALIEGIAVTYEKGSRRLTKLYESGDMCTRFEDYVLITTRQTASAREQENTMSGRRTSIAISTAIALGIVGAASAAQAGDSGENSQGGFVVPGSMVGVNPVYHPGWFGKSGSAGNAYGYAVFPTQKRYPVNERIRER
jgi:hypothetical protein